MAKKPRVRVTEANIEKARKKIKETPKRGRWPRWTDIHRHDLADYLNCFQNPDEVIIHEKYGNACFIRRSESATQMFFDKSKEKYQPIPTREVQTKAVIRFYCESYDPNTATPLIDTTCLLRCERISCPYYKKGFITESLKDKIFTEDVKLELNKKHNLKQEIKLDEEND
jgi:hypothetical protein